MILFFWKAGLSVFYGCFWQSILSLNDNEGDGCNRDLPTFADGNPSVFNVKRHSSTVSSRIVLINYAVGRMNREDASAWLVNASVNDFEWVQWSMLWWNILSSASLTPILVSTVSVNLCLEFLKPSPFKLAESGDEEIWKGVFDSLLHCLEGTSWALAAYFLRDETSNILVNVRIGFNIRVHWSRCRLGARCWGRRTTFAI